MSHCEARAWAKLDFHLNMSLAAVNVARMEMVSLGVSFNSYVRRAYNRFLVGSLLEQLGLEAEYGLKDPVIEAVVNTGRMAA